MDKNKHKKNISSLSPFKPNTLKEKSNNKTYILDTNQHLTTKNNEEKNILNESKKRKIKNTNIYIESQEKALNINKNNNDEDKIYLERQEKRLRKIKDKLRSVIISQFGINVLDFLCIKVFPKIFFNFFNIFSLLLILFFTLYIYIKFLQGFEEINRDYYKRIKNIFCLTITIMFIYFLNMLYEIIFQMLIFNLPDLEMTEIFKWLFLLLIYSTINISIPILLIFNLSDMKKNIKYFGILEGKDYSISTTMDCQTFNEINF